VNVQTPAEAADVDVIEKPWVEAAEKIIKDHENDPYKEQAAEEELQIDYQKKRYGKEIKKSDGA
jgi:hypothetical protein